MIYRQTDRKLHRQKCTQTKMYIGRNIHRLKDTEMTGRFRDKTVRCREKEKETGTKQRYRDETKIQIQN